MDTKVSLSDVRQKYQEQVKEILTQLPEWLDFDILERAIDSDHVHMYTPTPAKRFPSHAMKILKGKSAEYLRTDFLELRESYPGLHI